LRPPSFVNSARRRSWAPASNLPSAAIHSLQPTPHALASPLATKNTIGGIGADVPGVAGLLGGASGVRWAVAGAAAAKPSAAAIRRRRLAVMLGAGRPPDSCRA